MKVLWITNVPSPYRVDFFNLLGQQCELDVVFECKYSKERHSSWKNLHAKKYNAFFLKGFQYKTDMAFSIQIFKFLKKEYDIIMLTNYASLTGMIAILYMRVHHIPFIIEGDGAHIGSGKGLKEWLKRKLISGAKYWFATSEEHKKYYEFYGADLSKIIKYPFTSLHKKDILTSPTLLEDKIRLRRERGITENYVILSVGQFIHRKGYDILLQAATKLDKQIGIYIVGGKPIAEYTDFVKKNNLEQVHFLDFMNSEQLSYYFQLADVFVLPTREDIWGLVINEAMANAVPIITTDSCIAGVELLNRQCGHIVKKEDAVQLAFAIREVIDNIPWRCEAAQKCLDIISNYTLENMVKVHIRKFKSIIEEE